ncbi:unnamed protein product [Timema podura]|uniref:Uncharacterized protein n=1 Tax=Timema podura TaxID=61482 RepID=A0ABN7NU20_TIMPD|nr:unnamed protein product [Timema podura]
MSSNVAAECQGGDADRQETSKQRLQQLEQQLKACAEERDVYKKRLEAAERELKSQRTSVAGGKNNKKSGKHTTGSTTNQPETDASLRATLAVSEALIEDKTKLCANQERQIKALTHQVSSLREVVSITKDLLNIRNLEMERLQREVDCVQEKIAIERERQNKLGLAAKLNENLKDEYKNQLTLFQNLREKYEEKVMMLTKENLRLFKLTNELSQSKANSTPDQQETD